MGAGTCGCGRACARHALELKVRHVGARRTAPHAHRTCRTSGSCPRSASGAQIVRRVGAQAAGVKTRGAGQALLGPV
eukprot:366474-Chlamydomonas_euryale.AAC.30